MRVFFRVILLFINILAASALAGAYLSLIIPPDSWWMPSMLGLAYPYILTLNLCFFLFWLFVKPVYSWLSFVVIIAGINTMSRYLQFTGRETSKSDIKVVSYNVRHFTGSGNNPSRELAEVIKGFLKDKEPDIICLQEVRLRSNRVFNLSATSKEFPSIKHYQYATTSKAAGSVTMTRFPIIRMEEIRFQKSGNIAMSTDVVAGKDTIRIFNVHLQSYQIDPSRYRIIDSPGITEQQDIREAREIGSKLKRGMILRASQARMIRERIEESPYPVIVCGDFNDTPVSYAYRTVRGRLKDAFVSSGKGVGRTYAGKLPSYRIDYIFHSDFFRSYNFLTHEVDYSDHLPISCDLIRKSRD